MVYVELRFPLMGAALPCDHGQAMFRAISRLIPEAASADWLLVKAMRSARPASGALQEVLPARLRMRLPQSRVSRMLDVAHRRLQMCGSRERLRMLEISLLHPCAGDYAS